MPQASGAIRIVRCNGCDRLKAEVTYMIAGPHLFMCDRCVAQATMMLVYQFGISPDNADAKLRAVASLSYRAVDDVARKIVENGGL